MWRVTRAQPMDTGPNGYVCEACEVVQLKHVNMSVHALILSVNVISNKYLYSTLPRVLS